MRGRVKQQAAGSKPKQERAKPPPPAIDFATHPKMSVHYRDGIKGAKEGYKPKWFDEEATEWKCVERDAYRAGYRTVKIEG